MSSTILLLEAREARQEVTGCYHSLGKKPLERQYREILGFCGEAEAGRSETSTSRQTIRERKMSKQDLPRAI